MKIARSRMGTGLPAGIALIAFILALVGCRKPTEAVVRPPSKELANASQDMPQLVEITDSSGVAFTYKNGREAGVLSIVESLGGGVGMLDGDLDGWLDLFFPGGGQFGPGETLSGLPAAYFRQLAPRKFLDCSESTGLATPRQYSHGCTVGDFDQDGFPDLLVTGYGGLQLFHNQGDGTWRDIHGAAGLTDSSWSSSAGWGDFDGDGNLDLYVAHYVDWSWQNHPACPTSQSGVFDVCPPRSFRGLDDIIYFSQGDGTFRDASRDAGLAPEGKGLGVIICDADQDGDVDIYVANDTVANFFYRNDGGGVFAEIAGTCGLAMDDRGAPNGSMGLAVLDYNQDSRPDLWVTNYENEVSALYRNEGDANFTHVSEMTGIYALGSRYVSFGTASGDLDRDGDEDLLIANGHVIYHPPSGEVQQHPLLLLNEGNRFRKCSYPADSYFGSRHTGRGLSLGDVDNDGDLDCVFAHTNEPAAILENRTSNSNDWVGVRLIGRNVNRDAIGAWAVLHTSTGDLYRSVCGGGSYLSQHDRRLFWGLPQNAKVQGLSIHWPGGKVQELTISAPGDYLTVLEP